MKHKKIWPLLGLVLLVFAFFPAAAEDTPVLALPATLRVIEEEAFSGIPWLQAVILPEGLEEIHTRAFAGTAIEEIGLPGSLTYIAEDAFEDSALRRATAPAGTYAYDWAVAHGYLDAEGELTLYVMGGADAGRTGDRFTWTATGYGGTAPYVYAFTLFRDGEVIAQQDYDVEDSFTYLFEEPGEYCLAVRLMDGAGREREAFGEAIQIRWAQPRVTGLTCESEQFLTTQTQTWTAEAAGGDAPYLFAFTLANRDGVIESRPLSLKMQFSYTFFVDGDYTLTVTAQDAFGVASEPETFNFTVTLGNATIKGLVRIYIDCDAEGNILRDNRHTGHYDLQFVNETGISFDDRLYEEPVLSYAKDADSNGQVWAFEGALVPRTGNLLYTLEFAIEASLMRDFLTRRLAGTYLDTEAETEEAEIVKYDITNGPFSTYSIRTNNCFTAAAAWCKWLGYDALSKIVSAADSYTDYLAWRMFDAYGKNWTFVGQY